MEDLYIATTIMPNEDGEDYVDIIVYKDTKLARKEHKNKTFYRYEWSKEKQQYLLRLPF